MRRISLAVALLGAVAAAGCGGNKAPSANGGSKGVGNQTFTVTVQNGQNGNAGLAIAGGNVTSSPAGINCGVGITGTAACSATFPAGTTVVLTATPVGTDAAYALPYQFLGWAGDCQGDQGCSLSGNSDKYIVVMFAGKRSGHPNFSASSVHGKAYLDLQLGVAGALDCTQCHGANLQGAGIALSCSTCHSWPLGKHFDATAAAWGDHPNAAPCYRCHTTGGYQAWTASASYLGNPVGTYVGGTFTTTPAPASGPLACAACHNAVTDPLSGNGITSILFPSGVTVTTDKVSALCGQCHMARESTVSVNTLIGAVAADAQIDQKGVGKGTSFKNPHYRGAAATLNGSVAQGWAQYPGNNYTGQNEHGGAASCTVCHSAHTGEVTVTASTCGKCHFKADGTPVASMADLKANRQYGFEGDIDGDGVVASLDVEIAGLQAKLLAAMQAYATTVVGQGLCYDDANYSYFFNHTGTGPCVGTPNTAPSGQPSNATGDYATSFVSFTPRLMRAAYNLKFSVTDFGAWAHNPRYAIEILYDAITDLNAGLGANAVSFTGNRSFNGHFGAADAASPYSAFLYSATFGAQGFTSDACYQCHGGRNGLETYLTGAPAAMPVGTKSVVANKVTGMQCATCHALNGADMKSLRTIATVYFPPQKNNAAGQTSVAGNTLPASFAVCGTCHSGRENATTALSTITPGFTNGIKNPHYLGAAAMILGSTVAPMYQYSGQTYAAQAVFFNGTADGGPYGSPHGARCVACHDPKQTSHAFTVDVATTVPNGMHFITHAPFNDTAPTQNTYTCNGCHSGPYSLATPKANLDALAAQLLTAMQAYATANSQPVPCYNAVGYHGAYFFVQAADGTCPTTQPTYATADSHLAQAGFNYVWYGKEPGAFAHNYNYMAEALYDGIVDLDAAMPTPVTPAIVDATSQPMARP